MCVNTVAHIGTRSNHVFVTCERLLNQYRHNPGATALRSIFDTVLMNAIPIDRLERFPDPDPARTIAFGPPEDRFHMQLAIDAGAKFHVTMDGGVLAQVTPMEQRGVREVHPRKFLEECCSRR